MIVPLTRHYICDSLKYNSFHLMWTPTRWSRQSSPTPKKRTGGIQGSHDYLYHSPCISGTNYYYYRDYGSLSGCDSDAGRPALYLPDGKGCRCSGNARQDYAGTVACFESSFRFGRTAI